MPEDMKQEVIEVTATAIEKFFDNYQKAAHMVKDELDKKFGGPFNVVVGESFSYCVTHQKETMMMMFTNGNIAALIWRSVIGG